MPPLQQQQQPPTSDQQHFRRTILARHRRTGPLTWLVAVVCGVISTTVIIAGILVVVIYVSYQPTVPSLGVSSSQLIRLDYDPKSGLLGTKMAVDLVAVNRNAKSDARLSSLGLVHIITGLFLRFGRTAIAELQSEPFDVPKNGTFSLAYAVESSEVRLDEAAKEEIGTELQRNTIGFRLEGHARTHWRIGLLVRVGFWTHLNCQLLFFPSNGSSIGVQCSSSSQSHH